MTELKALLDQIIALAATSDRIIVAIAGAPGSGKSTVVSKLAKSLGSAVVVPMDGFHLDNGILQTRGMMARKGCPDSFDTEGYLSLLRRIKEVKGTVYAPVFDRNADLSKSGAIEIPPEVKVVLTEGNYLLLEQAPWNQLHPLFDLSVLLTVDEATLRERLIDRWLTQGASERDAIKRAESNDLINAKLVDNHSTQADVFIRNF